ncbi:MAG: amidohydrolase [Desulfobacterales bacterium]|nr:amidohydrolase [Desulfobacterales bacterium]MDX2508807.1 amidohydrolase [Desulfobacterales bacterium]
MNFDTVIHNCTIITVDPDFDIIKHGIICIKDGRLVRISAKAHEQELPDSREVIDAKGGIVLPGLVNTHTHLPMTLFRGLADDLPLNIWLNEHIFPAEKENINPKSVRYGTLLACSEMLLSGTTTCCDGYFLEEIVAEAVNESGIRAILGQGVIDFPAPGVADPSENIKTAVAFVKKWLGVSPNIIPSIFCHSPYTCSTRTLKDAKTAADNKGLLFQIHVSETKQELNQIQSEHRMTPVEYLDSIGILDANTLLAHCVWIDDHDIEIIAKQNAKISHNPESNMKLAAGVAPVPRFLDSGITVGLGTDGCASNNNLDLFQEMDTTAKLHKVISHDPTVMDAKSVIIMATIGGAKAIGLGNEIGSIEVGKQADLIIIDTDKPHLTPLYNPVSHIVYAASGSDVRDVLVAGEFLVRNRKLLTLDLDETLERVTEISKVISSKN